MLPMRIVGCTLSLALAACVGDDPAPPPAPAPAPAPAPGPVPSPTADAGPGCTSLKGNYKLANECTRTKEEPCTATQTGCEAVFTCPSGAITVVVKDSTYTFSPSSGVTCTGSVASDGRVSGSCNATPVCTFSGQKQPQP